MHKPTDAQLESALMSVMSDAFNRCFSVLEAAGAIDAKEMRTDYRGVGSKYYDLVTEQIGLSAKYAVPGIRQLLTPPGNYPAGS